MAVWRGIREIVSLIAYCQLDRPAALAGDAPDIVAAGNVRLEIYVLAVNRPAKSKHGTRVIESVNIQRTVGWIGWASDGVAGQFRSWSRNHLDPGGEYGIVRTIARLGFFPSRPESFEAFRTSSVSRLVIFQVRARSLSLGL